jgi:hypothetical protein
VALPSGVSTVISRSGTKQRTFLLPVLAQPFARSALVQHHACARRTLSRGARIQMC